MPRAASAAPAVKAAPLEYPTMLYRGGTEIVWEGKSLDTRIVAHADDYAAAADDGWLTAADLATV